MMRADEAGGAREPTLFDAPDESASAANLFSAGLEPLPPAPSHGHVTHPVRSLYDLRDDVPSALIVVDIQRDWYSASAQVRSAFPDLPENVDECLRIFRARAVPVVHVRAQYSCPLRSRHMSYFKKLNPEKPGVVSLDAEPWASELPGEVVVFKPTFDGFHHTNLHEELQRMGVERVYVCGLVTAACVLNTCFGAFRHGYEVVLVSDCTGDRSRAQHEAIISIYNGYTFVAASLAELASFVHDESTAETDGSAAGARSPRLRSAEQVEAMYAECVRSGSGCAPSDADFDHEHEQSAANCEQRSARELRSVRLQLGERRVSPGIVYTAGADASSSCFSIASASSSSSSGSASSAASDAGTSLPASSASAPLVSSAGGGLRAGLSGLALLARALSIGLYCIAAGHGLDERLVLSPLRSPLLSGRAASAAHWPAPPMGSVVE